MATAHIVNITDIQGNEIYPQTLTSLVIKQDGQTLESLILSKDNTQSYTPTENYNPATKSYVDNKSRIQMVVSQKKPQSMKKGDIWYEVYVPPYDFAKVNSLGYTFGDVDDLGLTWAESDEGGW